MEQILKIDDIIINLKNIIYISKLKKKNIKKDDYLYNYLPLTNNGRFNDYYLIDFNINLSNNNTKNISILERDSSKKSIQFIKDYDKLINLFINNNKTIDLF